MSIAGFTYGMPIHHFDHIASLCLYLNLPLIVTEPEAETLIQTFYPSLVIYQFDYRTMNTDTLSRFDTLLSCHPRPYLDRMFSFAEELLGKKLKSIFIPHGNSDKGHASKHMEALSFETNVAVYGQKMIDFLKEKNVYSHIENLFTIGNVREKVYTRFKPHFQKLLNIPHEKKTLLYAPTWDDGEGSNSLFKTLPYLIENKPEDLSLIVKPHPNTFATHPAAMEKLEADLPGYFVRNFPPVYALLDLADIYLGDMSSMGYDFLTYNKPMFFSNHNRRDPKTDRGLQLYRCGETIYEEHLDSIYAIIDHPQVELKKARHDMYRYTFDEAPSPEKLLTQLEAL